MTYYEELGVSQSAPPEQIQEAYRVLAALLHPDRQHKPTLRAAAERQMQRLNAMAATLRDPHARSQYDAELQSLKPAPARPDTLAGEALSTRIIWCLCLLVGFAGIFSYLREDLRRTDAFHASRAPHECPEAAALRARIHDLERQLALRVRPRVRGPGEL